MYEDLDLWMLEWLISENSLSGFGSELLSSLTISIIRMLVNWILLLWKLKVCRIQLNSVSFYDGSIDCYFHFQVMTFCSCYSISYEYFKVWFFT